MRIGGHKSDQVGQVICLERPGVETKPTLLDNQLLVARNTSIGVEVIAIKNLDSSSWDSKVPFNGGTGNGDFDVETTSTSWGDSRLPWFPTPFQHLSTPLLTFIALSCRCSSKRASKLVSTWVGDDKAKPVGHFFDSDSKVLLAFKDPPIFGQFRMGWEQVCKGSLDLVEQFLLFLTDFPNDI